MPILVREKNKNHNVFTYRRLRRAIGYLGAGLPVILVLLSQIDFFKTPTQGSISYYYYTNLREIYTGTLCAIGFFLICYRGHGNKSVWKNDNLLTNIMGFMAVTVALIPTNPDCPSIKIYSVIPYDYSLLGGLHYLCAGILFLTFSILAINVFTLGQEKKDGLPQNTLNENNIYRFCGYCIIGLVALIPVFSLLKVYKYSTLLFEALVLLLFGIAWLVKGRALGDKGETGRRLYNESNSQNTETMYDE